MKAAVLLQGDPRFCKEFDTFLENLKGFDQVDYLKTVQHSLRLLVEVIPV